MNNIVTKIFKGASILALIFVSLKMGQDNGYKKGFDASGGTFSALSQEEMSKTTNFSQYLSGETALNEALSSNLYSHCVSYPGVGLVFSSQNQSGENVVLLTIGGSEIDKLKAKGIVISKGDIIVTPISVIRGDLNSPLKIEYRKLGDKSKKTKSILLSRKMLSKCYLKTPRDNAEDNDNIQAY